MTTNILYRSIAKIINLALHADPDSAERMQPLENKLIRVNIKDWNLNLDLKINDGNMQLYAADENIDADCTITSKLSTLLKASQQKRNKKAALTPGIHIEGYTHVAEAMWQLLGDLDIDWEQQISKLTGDSIAFRISQALRSGKEKMQQQKQWLGEQTSSYLQREAEVLPTSHKVKHWQDEVSTLRNDVERLQARIDRVVSALSDVK